MVVSFLANAHRCLKLALCNFIIKLQVQNDEIIFDATILDIDSTLDTDHCLLDVHVLPPGIVSGCCACLHYCWCTTHYCWCTTLRCLFSSFWIVFEDSQHPYIYNSLICPTYGVMTWEELYYRMTSYIYTILLILSISCISFSHY